MQSRKQVTEANNKSIAEDQRLQVADEEAEETDQTS